MVCMEFLLDRTTDRHSEHPPLARTLAGACAQMLVEAHAQTNRYMEVRARILVESRTWMLAEACVRTFLLRVQACTKARDIYFY